MKLPPNVFAVYDARTGLPRYYWQTGRSGPKADRSKCIRVPHRTDEPAFWQECDRLNGVARDASAGTFADAIKAFQESTEWLKKSESTRYSYGLYLEPMKAAWGNELVSDITVPALVALRDKLAAGRSANTANQALLAWRTFFAWCAPRGLISSNIARDVPALDHEPEITAPWPEHIWQHVVDHGPARVSRLAVLGRATGQRISDIVRLGPTCRRADGIDIPGGVKKTGRVHWCALSATDAARIDSWRCDLRPYLDLGDGRSLTTDAVGAELREWLQSDAAGIAKGAAISPHGLRAMAVCDERVKGLEHQEIASLFAMSLGMVMRYSTHIDHEIAGRAARRRSDASGTTVKSFSLSGAGVSAKARKNKGL